MRNLISIIDFTIVRLLSFVWIFFGVAKILDYSTFSRQLQGEGFAEGFATVLSFAIPIMAFFVAIAMLLARAKKIGLFLSLSLLIVFTAYMIYILNFASPLPCSCIGFTSRLSWNQHLFISASLLVLNLASIVLLSKEKLRNAEHRFS